MMNYFLPIVQSLLSWLIKVASPSLAKRWSQDWVRPVGLTLTYPFFTVKVVIKSSTDPVRLFLLPHPSEASSYLLSSLWAPWYPCNKFLLLLALARIYFCCLQPIFFFFLLHTRLILALKLSSCLTFCKLFNPSKLQFPHLKNMNVRSYPQPLLWRLENKGPADCLSDRSPQ